MKIGIDARWIFPKISGIGLYTQELIGHLAHVDRENQYVLFFDHASVLERTAEHTQFNTAPNFITHMLPYGPFSLKGQLDMPQLFRDMHLDIFHSPNYMIPFFAFPKKRAGRTRCVVTIHDLIPLIFPHHTPRALKTRLHPIYRAIMKEVGLRSDIIITVSEASRTDILKHLEIGEERADNVVVITEGVGKEYQPPKTKDISSKTILYVGRLDPYKNVPILVRAFAEVLKTIPEARLRIIGPQDDRYPEAANLCDELGVRDRVDWSGYIDSDGLLRAYQDAAVLALPSSYEGFGLPLVEAMACGTPVVCSNRSSLPEVVGDAAILVEPKNTPALTEALIEVLSDHDRADELSDLGLQRATHFDWNQTAKQTVQAYELAMKQEAS